MHRHRFREQLAKEEIARRPSVASQGFMMCPVALSQGLQGQACPWEEVYRLAFAQTQAVVRPSRLECFEPELRN